MRTSVVALFGEAERGDYRVPYRCHSVLQLHDLVGNPPKDSHGIYYAVQALLHDYALIFMRVREEGYSYSDYFYGIKVMEKEVTDLSAICIPGVGDAEIIDAVAPVCAEHNSILIVTEADLYDYLTE